jgi:thioredoxin
MNRYRRNRAPGAVLFAIFSIITLIASCGPSGDRKAGDSLPLIVTREDLDSAAARAGTQMVVLDLYADWCGPCRVLAPVLHELAREHKGKAAFYRINVDRSNDLARSFGVQGIPYVIFMKDGKPVYSLTGLNPKENYQKVLTLCSGTPSADECINLLNEKMN